MANAPVPDTLDQIEALRQIMAQLRAKVGGCPWDVAQNFATIAPYTIEEAYEVADAIARGDMPGLCGELGDLLLQVVFHAQMAQEAGHFNFEDVVRGINEKMLRRHPHVFGDADIQNAAQQTASWEAIKQVERAAKQALSGAPPESRLDGVRTGQNAWQRALKLQQCAAQFGFDWPSVTPVLEKLREELAEFIEAVEIKDANEQLEELGDLLFVAVNAARHLKLDPAEALRGCNLKFESRFRAMERLANAQGLVLENLNLEQQDALWDQAKLEEKVAKLASARSQK